MIWILLFLALVLFIGLGWFIGQHTERTVINGDEVRRIMRRIKR